MSNVNEVLNRASSGENRLKPDEQRKFLGTYEERVIYSVLLNDSRETEFQSNFSKLLSSIDPNLKCSIKISSLLPTAEQVQLMKKAKEAQLRATIFDEENLHSPYGIVIHTDHAINQEIHDVKTLFPDLFTKAPLERKDKKSLLQKLFKR